MVRIKHNLTLSAPSDTMKLILVECFTKDGELDLSSILPVPAIYDAVESGSATSSMAKQQAGYSSRERWCRSNWGSMSNASDTAVDVIDPATIHLRFETQEGSPVRVLERLSEKYPGSCIEGCFFEWVWQFSSEISVADGEADVTSQAFDLTKLHRHLVFREQLGIDEPLKHPLIRAVCPGLGLSIKTVDENGNVGTVLKEILTDASDNSVEIPTYFKGNVQ